MNELQKRVHCVHSLLVFSSRRSKTCLLFHLEKHNQEDLLPLFTQAWNTSSGFPQMLVCPARTPLIASFLSSTHIQYFQYNACFCSSWLPELCPSTSTADPLVVLVDGACKRADIKDSCPSGMLSWYADSYLICNTNYISSNVLGILCLPRLKNISNSPMASGNSVCSLATIQLFVV